MAHEELPDIDHYENTSSKNVSASQELSWSSTLGEFSVEMHLQRSLSSGQWSGKAYITSADGIVLDNMSTLYHETKEEAHVELTSQVSLSLSHMGRSHMTGSFPFVQL